MRETLCCPECPKLPQTPEQLPATYNLCLILLLVEVSSLKGWPQPWLWRCAGLGRG